MKSLHSCLLALAALPLSSAIGAAPPVSAFTNYPKLQSVQISPSGKYFAVTNRSEEFELINILRYPDLSFQNSAHFGDQIDINSYEWVSDSRLLIHPARRFIGYRAYKVPTGEIIGVDVEGKNSDLLFGYRAGKEETGHLMQFRKSTDAWAKMFKVLPENTGSVLIQTGSYDRTTNSSSLQRMDVRNGKLARLAGSPVWDPHYVVDTNNQPAYVWGSNDKGDLESYRFKPGDRSWQLLATSANSNGIFEPFAVSENPKELLAFDSLTTPTASIIVWNPDTKERRVLFQKDISDAYSEGTDPSGKIWVYGYNDHYHEYWYPDPEHPLAKVHRGLRAGFKDANIRIESSTRDMSLAVAQISAPRIPQTYYLVDVKNLKLLQAMPAYPDLKKEDLSPMDPFEVVVRDGVKIRGYLTTPNGSTGKGMPMIVMLHGGPHGAEMYDRYDFDWEAQLFASRGYSVLQVNFRGSGGRGRDFTFSGYGQWGRQMQDDVTDAIKWAIASGIADRNRICTYGGSYGAYAALTEAFREPDLIKCAVGMSGIYDLPLMFEKGDIQEREAGVNYLKDALGTDMNDLRSRSPVYNADKIKAHVMLIHGKDDLRAPFEHAKRLRDALEKAGNAPVWISESGEAHGIYSEAHRADVYNQMLAFFAKYLDAPANKAPAN